MEVAEAGYTRWWIEAFHGNNLCDRESMANVLIVDDEAPVREALGIGLAEGGDVDVELDGAAVRIQPVSGVDLREDGALLVIPATGMAVSGATVRELIDADRHGR